MATLEEIIQLAKRRGFVFPSSEIYDGFAGVYDYGPLGVELANNLKQRWWHTMVRTRPDIFGLDSGITMHPKIWEASGHTKGFADPVTVCKKTGKRFRADHLLEEIGVSADERMSIEEFREVFAKHKTELKVAGCDPNDLSEPEFQNLLVTSNLGTFEEDEVTYLRGETCQGIYVNFKQVVDTMHPPLPFGIAQIGKAFRNEISPRQFLFRTREFEQMEMQYFHRQDSKRYFDEFLALRLEALKAIGIQEEHLQVTPHERLVFYAKAAVDIEYQYPFGWKELEGIHDRGNYDLTQHTEHSGQKLTYFDQEKNEHIVPNIIETSIGVGRLFLAVLCDAYDKETLEDGTERVLLRLHPSLAPMTVAVLPLMRKDGHPEKAKEVYASLAEQNYSVYYDETGAIGKRYRRADEIGTPFAVTIDYDTLEDETVTVRERDSMQQNRVPIKDLQKHLQSMLQQ